MVINVEKQRDMLVIELAKLHSTIRSKIFCLIGIFFLVLATLFTASELLAHSDSVQDIDLADLEMP